MAIQTTDEHLKVFADACLEYQKQFGLTNWELHFKRDDIEFISQCVYNLPGCIVMIKLCTEWRDQDLKLNDDNLRDCARHEMLHLLLGRLTSYALWRFVTEDIIHEADEEVVRRLEYILDHQEVV